MTTFVGPLTFQSYASPGNHLTDDVVVFSHLRWNFVYQRPQHLLARIAKNQRVFFIEEAIFSSTQRGMGCLVLRQAAPGVTVATPHLPPHLPEEQIALRLRRLLEDFLRASVQRRFVAWYYTPMALSFTSGLKPTLVVYDCMDELSSFAGAHPSMKKREIALLARADVVFTGGESLYQYKKHLHRNIHAFPSSIDAVHFRKARLQLREPDDISLIPRPRAGFFGVIDERFDIGLLGNTAAARPDWNFIVIGPVVKIDPRSLPRSQNIHYLGGRSYESLPSYLAHWDVAMLPFALNEATRFISPTKTPEYLAGGKPVISTPIRDVVTPYANLGLVEIASSAEEFSRALDAALRQSSNDGWLKKVDTFLEGMSWDATWSEMESVIMSAYREKHPDFFPLPESSHTETMRGRLSSTS